MKPWLYHIATVLQSWQIQTAALIKLPKSWPKKATVVKKAWSIPKNRGLNFRPRAYTPQLDFRGQTVASALRHGYFAYSLGFLGVAGGLFSCSVPTSSGFNPHK